MLQIGGGEYEISVYQAGMVQQLNAISLITENVGSTILGTLPIQGATGQDISVSAALILKLTFSANVFVFFHAIDFDI